jgi:hypothetical protein
MPMKSGIKRHESYISLEILAARRGFWLIGM